MSIKELIFVIWYGEARAKAKIEEEDGGWDYFPVSVLVSNPEANLNLHKFLLKSLDSNKFDTISVMGTDYEVGVVSINPAPEIPPAQTPTAVTGS